MKMLLSLVFLIEALAFSVLAVDLKIVLIAEKQQPEVSGWFGDALQDIQSKTPGLKLIADTIFLDREEEEESYAKLCASLSKGASVIFDTVWAPWTQLEDLISGSPLLPFVRSAFGESASPMDAVLQLLQTRKATDAVFIFQNEQGLDQALYNILGKSTLRILAMEGVHRKIGDMRPAPGNVVIIGKREFIQESYKQAVEMELVKLPDRWILASTDLSFYRLDPSVLKEPACLIGYGPAFSCRLQGIPSPCHHDENIPIDAVVMNKMIDVLSDSLMKINQKIIKVDCTQSPSAEEDQRVQHQLYKALADKTESKDSLFFWDKVRRGLFLRADYIIKTGGPKGLRTAAEWITSSKELTQVNNTEIKTPRRFFRIGTTPAIPWTYPKIDRSTGKEVFNNKGEPLYEGYCMDLIQKLSEQMDFDYEIVTPKSGTFGWKHKNGSWDGLIGDLHRGDTDIAVAATIMTSQREEAVDFVAPYFEQTGISIGLFVFVCLFTFIEAIRKPVSKTSLFKFMTVLRVEVWLSILAALTLTAGLLALLDKYSPYSARNNKKIYPYPCREFTLKESFWFALTSFTPQGGGEAPKALSGRALVAAYWLFVVLMLATFTANLAAFLTVERMQTPVSSLEQLARQSRINYTVVRGHIAHQYFINMKHAEDTLYRVWKEITLNSSADESIYQVWDYPIREQYGHILLAINSSQPLPNAEVAFKKVNENEQADFAFIHDSSEIKYEVSRNCNLTIVGEVFGERPYAIAVQQGSRLQEELSKAVLELQKQRFLEGLTAKYWNRTCDDGDESEGITLDSLGGVFIATLFGLALAMITLAWEVFFYKRKERKNKIKALDGDPKDKMTTGWGNKASDKPSVDYKLKAKHRNVVTIGESFRPAIEKQKPKVSYINVDPKSRWNP